MHDNATFKMLQDASLNFDSIPAFAYVNRWLQWALIAVLRRKWWIEFGLINWKRRKLGLEHDENYPMTF